MKPIPVSFDELVVGVPWYSVSTYRPDVIVAIARGGLVLGALIATRLGCDLIAIRISLYDDSKPVKELHDKPKITAASSDHLSSIKGKRVLIVDDVSKTGRTFEVAKQEILRAGALDVRTFAYAANAGKADFSCRSFDMCLRFPWEKSSSGAQMSHK